MQTSWCNRTASYSKTMCSMCGSGTNPARNSCVVCATEAQTSSHTAKAFFKKPHRIQQRLFTKSRKPFTKFMCSMCDRGTNLIAYSKVFVLLFEKSSSARFLLIFWKGCAMMLDVYIIVYACECEICVCAYAYERVIFDESCKFTGRAFQGNAVGLSN